MHQLALEVTLFDKELRQLVQDLFDTMDKAPGVGLVAPQIGVGLRVFVYSYPDDDDNPRRGVVINPTLTHSTIEAGPADDELESEGCLSFPGKRFALKRGASVIVEGVDLDNKPVRIEAEGWFARIFQHEFDHLEGTLYVDRLNAEYNAEAKEIIAERGWGKDGLSWLPGQEKLEG